MFGILLSCLIFSGCEKSSDKKELDANEVIDRLNETVNISVKKKDTETVLGMISDMDTIQEIILFMSKSIETNPIDANDSFHCDGYGIELGMYDENNSFIDTIYVWNDGRFIPESLHSGCAYYTSFDDFNFIDFIEASIDYKFYILMGSSDTCSDELVFEDENYQYYFDCENLGSIDVQFLTSGTTKPLKEALKDKDLDVNELLENYSDVLIKKLK